MDRPDFSKIFGIQVVPDSEYQAMADAEQKRIDEIAREAARAKALTALAKIDAPIHWTCANFDETHWPHWEELCDNAKLVNPVSCMIAGGTSTGKSHCAMSLARIHAEKGRTCYRMTEPDLARMYSQYKWSRSERLDEIYDNMTQAEILIYDDAGKIEIAKGLALTDFGAFVFSIFDKRAERKKRNIITTRYTDIAELSKAVGADMVRRYLQDEPRQNGIIAAYQNKSAGMRAQAVQVVR